LNTESEAAKPEASAWESDHLSPAGWHVEQCTLRELMHVKSVVALMSFMFQLCIRRCPAADGLSSGSWLKIKRAKSDFHLKGIA